MLETLLPYCTYCKNSGQRIGGWTEAQNTKLALIDDTVLPKLWHNGAGYLLLAMNESGYRAWTTRIWPFYLSSYPSAFPSCLDSCSVSCVSPSSFPALSIVWRVTTRAWNGPWLSVLPVPPFRRYWLQAWPGNLVVLWWGDGDHLDTWSLTGPL